MILLVALPLFFDDFDDASNLESYDFELSGSALKNLLKISAFGDDEYATFGAYFYNNKIYIAWADNRANGVHRVYFNRLDVTDPDSPTLEFSDFEVASAGASIKRVKIFVYDDNNIYIAYIKPRPPSYYYTQAFCKKLVISGGAVQEDATFGEIQLDTTTSGDTVWIRHVDIVADANYLYAVYTRQPQGSGTTVYCRRFSASDGTNDGTWGTITPIGSTPFEITADAFIDSGSLYIAIRGWYWYSPDNRGIWMDKLSTVDASSQWASELRVDGSLADNYWNKFVQIAYDSANSRMYVSWVDKREGAWDCWLQRVDPAAGSTVWTSPVKINGASPSSQYLPTITVMGGDVYCAYQVQNSEGPDEIYLCRFDDLGNRLLTDKYLFSSDSTGYQVLLTDGTYLYLVWEQKDSDGSQHIKVSRIDSLGNVGWTVDASSVQYMESGEAVSNNMLFTPPAGSVKTITLVSADTTGTTGGTITYSVSPDGGANWYAVSAGGSVSFPSIGDDLRWKVSFSGDGTQAFVLNNIQFRADEYVFADLYGSFEDSSYIGDGVQERAPSEQVLRQYIMEGNNAWFYFKYHNTGNLSDTSFILVGDGSSTNWTVNYYDEADNPVDPTAGYTLSLNADEYKKFKLKITPVNPSEGETRSVYIYSFRGSTSNPVHDCFEFKTTLLKRHPDLMLSLDGSSYTGDDVYENEQGVYCEKRTAGNPDNSYYVEVTPSGNVTQKVSRVLNAFDGGAGGEKGEFYIKIENEGTLDDTVTLSIETYSGDASHWDFELDGGAISLPYTNSYSVSAASSKTLQLDITPKSTGGPADGEVLTLKVTVTSQSPYLNVDLGLIEVQAILVQPDLLFSVDKTSWSFDDQYYKFDDNNPGSVGAVQTAPDLYVEPGHSVGFYIKAQNDGDTSDNCTLTASAAPAGWSVVYKLNGPTGTDITSQVTGSGYSLTLGSDAVIYAEVSATSTVLNSTFNVQLNLTSGLRPSARQDVLSVPVNCVDVSPSVAASPSSKRATQSQTVSFTVDVSNNGSSTDKIAVTFPAEPSGWTLSITGPNDDNGDPPDAGVTRYYTLAASSSVSFTIDVTPGTTVTYNSTETFTVSAQSTYISYEQSQSSFDVTCVDIQPELLVGAEPNPTTNSDSSKMVIGRPRRWWLDIKNNGASSEQYVLTGQDETSGTITGGTWQVKYYRDDTNEDITSSVTGGGWTTPEIEAGGKFTVRVEVTPLSGAAGDSINIQFTQTSVTNSSITATADCTTEIVQGFPDLYLSSHDDFGKGYDTPSGAGQTLYRKLEKGESFEATLVLENMDASNSADFELLYSLNKSPSDAPDPTVTITPDVSTGWTGTLAGGGTQSFSISVSLDDSTPSGALYELVFDSHLQLATDVKDVLKIQLQKVCPAVSVKIAQPGTPLWEPSGFKNSVSQIVIKKGEEVVFYFGIFNEDTVSESFTLSGVVSSDLWQVNFYDESGTDVTSQILSGTYETMDVGPGSYYLIKASVKPLPTASSGDICDVSLSATSKKNSSVKSTAVQRIALLYYSVKGRVVDGTTGKLLSNVKVSVKSPVESYTTTVSGDFEIRLYPMVGGQAVLTFSKEGFVPRVVRVATDADSQVEVSLAPIDIDCSKFKAKGFPNPARCGQSFYILVGVPKSSHLRVLIYDMAGRLVKKITDENVEAGVHYFVWDMKNRLGESIVPGVYIMVVESNGKKMYRRVVVR